MTKDLANLTSICSNRTTEPSSDASNCTKDSKSEFSDYFEEVVLSAAPTVSHQCTIATTYNDSTEIKLFLIIQTSIIAVLFIIIFVIALIVKSSNSAKLQKCPKGPQGSLWLNKNANYHSSAFNVSYDELPTKPKPKPANYEDVLPTTLMISNENHEDDVNNEEVEEDLYIDLSEKDDNKDDGFNLYAIPKKNQSQ